MRVVFAGGSGKAGHRVLNCDQVALGHESLQDLIGDITDAGHVY